MTIALDYDGTYTADPALWDEFIQLARSRGHKVVCVTARRETLENVELCDVPGVLTYFTCMAPKQWYMRQKRQMHIDVWIDDNVEAILHGH